MLLLNIINNSGIKTFNSANADIKSAAQTHKIKWMKFFSPLKYPIVTTVTVTHKIKFNGILQPE
ncbi:hypothetical protein EfmJHP36_22690 [Enterococcus faecium]|nr:hypothetical protein EfmJHP36_22690 [Enterococcus faecium]